MKTKILNDNIKINKFYMQGLIKNFRVDNIEFAKYTIFYYHIIKFLQFFRENEKFNQYLIYNLIY